MQWISKTKINLHIGTAVTFFIISASMNGWMLYAPRMRLTPGYNSRPRSTNTKPWKGISGFSSGCYTHKHKRKRTPVKRKLRSHARLTEQEKCSSESSHQLGISCFLPHYLQRPQSVVEDLLAQPETRVNSKVAACFTYWNMVSLGERRGAGSCLCVLVCVCVCMCTTDLAIPPASRKHLDSVSQLTRCFVVSDSLRKSRSCRENRSFRWRFNNSQGSACVRRDLKYPTGH